MSERKSSADKISESYNWQNSSGQHWQNPGTLNTTTMSQVEDKSNKGVSEIDSATDKTQQRLYEKANEQYNKPKEELEQNAGKNIAKTGGQYGSLTGKTFSNTLNLMRRADAYNNKPESEMFSVGTRHTGGVKNLGTGYQKPVLETEEMREMQRNRQLDFNQKQLAQALQDAVNHKDLNAFMQLYQILYNTELTRNQAEILMRQWTRQQEMSNILMKDVTTFNAFFSRYFSEETCRYIYDLGLERPTIANMLVSTVLAGTVPPDVEDYLLEQVQIQKTNEYIRRGYSYYDAYERARQEIEHTERMRHSVDAEAIKRDQSFMKRRSAKKQAKEISR